MLNKISLLLFIVFVIYSCGGGKTKPEKNIYPLQYGFGSILDRDGTKKPKVLMKLINADVKWDTLKGEYKMKIDTLYGVEREVKAADTTQPPKNIWVQLPKDSVINFQYNKELDSTMKVGMKQ